jgi:hypothetical protein
LILITAFDVEADRRRLEWPNFNHTVTAAHILVAEILLELAVGVHRTYS